MEIESSADFVRMTRGALAASGFVREERDGLVWWQNDPLLPREGEKVPKADEGAEARGRGEDTIVLVHGVNDQAGTWFTIAPRLARTHRVILPDLPGHGESAPKDGPLPISMLVARLHDVIDKQRVTLLGNSLGGWIAMLYTLAHPENVGHLVLEASGGLARPFASPVIAHDREEALLILRNVHGPRFAAKEWVIESLLARATDSPMLRITEAEQHIMDPRLGELRVPATLIWGADDGVLPLSSAAALRDGIEGARLHVIEDAAHIPHLQQPERFLACLTSIS